MATKPAVPVDGGEEREILDWLLRALKDNMTGALPGALGLLGIEADKFKRIGMPIEEAARRAMDSNPHLVSMAKLLIGDARRNAPENKPVPADKANALAQGKTPGETVDLRTVALMEALPHLDYRASMAVVLRDDPALHIGRITSDGAVLITFVKAPGEVPVHPPETAGQRLVEYLLREEAQAKVA